MLFQSYPFCRAEDKDDPDQLKKLLLRTLECNFSFPEEKPVSDECKDLIRRILKPAKDRITIEEITRHPWFVKDLPSGALGMNENLRLRKGTKIQVTSFVYVSAQGLWTEKEGNRRAHRRSFSV